jgi:hypothetical protein
MSFHLVYSEIGYLLTGRSNLSHLLTSSVKLLGQPSTHQHLFSKAVLGVLVLPEKLGLFVTTRHEGLWAPQVRSTKKGEIKDRSTNRLYLANRVNDVVQRPQHRIQNAGREPNSSLDPLSILPLHGIIKGEEHHP